MICVKISVLARVLAVSEAWHTPVLATAPVTRRTTPESRGFQHQKGKEGELPSHDGPFFVRVAIAFGNREILKPSIAE